MDDEGENVEPMTLETTITDLIEQNTKLGCERAAAVNHFTSILALAPVVYRWKKKLPWYVSFSAVARENMAKIDGYIGASSTVLDAYARDLGESWLQCRRGQP